MRQVGIEEIAGQCRFTFVQGGARYGLTTDHELVGRARQLGLYVSTYWRDGRTKQVQEFEIGLPLPLPSDAPAML